MVEYLEDLVNKELLKEKKIIVNGNWEVHFVFTFVQESARYKSDYIFMPSTPPRIVKSDQIKTYEALIPKKLIDQSPNPYLRTIELVFEAVRIFLTRTYKKSSQKDMDLLWQKVDLDFLLSLPYPAPLAEQKYLTDVVLPNGEVKDALDVYKKEGPFELKRSK